MDECGAPRDDGRADRVAGHDRDVHLRDPRAGHAGHLSHPAAPGRRRTDVARGRQSLAGRHQRSRFPQPARGPGAEPDAPAGTAQRSSDTPLPQHGGVVTLITVMPASGVMPPVADEAFKNVQPPSFTVVASAAPASVSPGAQVSITATYLTPIAGAAVIGVGVFAPGHASLVYQQWLHNETFGAGESRSYQFTWTVPASAASGTYVVNANAYSTGWRILYGSNNSAASFNVVSGPAQPVPTATVAPTFVPPSVTSTPAPTALPTATSAPTALPSPAAKIGRA